MGGADDGRRLVHGVPVEISYKYNGADERVLIDYDESINRFRIISSHLGARPDTTEWIFGQRTAAALIQLLRLHIADAVDERHERHERHER